VAHLDPELELYRGLMDYPERFEEGFDIKAVFGALFVGFVMMPGAIYLGLLAGQSLGSAAEWTTIILFTEVARRSFVQLKRQEVYILFYIASGLTSMQGGVALAGGAFAGKMWDQYFVRSPAAKAMGISNEIPHWVVPPPDSPALAQRTFFHQDWILPSALLLLGTILGRMNWFGGGYALFRVTSDYQRLPYPFAAITAQGSTALAESTSKTETWRWRVFSIGAMIGLVFGTFYVGVPTITGVILNTPLQLLPIPWLELTRSTESILPAVPTGLVTDLGLIGGGFVAPFWSVVGSVIMTVVTAILNPYLQRQGVLSHWRPGMDTISTGFVNNIDFYFSVNIGVQLAVALIGFYMISQSFRMNRALLKKGERPQGSWTPPPERGDMPMWLAIGMWAVSTLAYVILCRILVPDFNIWYVVAFGFFLTPIESYVNALMIGITGQSAGLPMVKEATFIFSGYRGYKIWFAPIPYSNIGGQAMSFRVLELTGTKITSLIKAELMIWPITIFCSLLFWQFIWKLAPVPSVYYPYAQKMWHMQALNQGLWMSATQNPEQSMFYKAWTPRFAVYGFAFAVVTYAALTSFKAPITLLFGIVRGLGTTCHWTIPTFIGALISQYYFIPRFGARLWKQYATVLMAGYACGFGLIGMGAVALALIGKSVSQLPY
jgi:hypothetical protein